MKHLAGLTMACVCVAAFASGALADPANLTKASGSNTYFNRPGADMATHDREVGECLALATREHQPSAGISPSFLVNSFLSEEMAAKSAVALSSNTENCMVVRGWRVVAIPQDEADAIAKLDRASQAQQLSQWVGAATPHGDIVRVWANDFADAATIKYKTAPWTGRPNLSLSAMDLATEQRALTVPPGAAADKALKLARPLSPDEVGTVARNSAVVIFRIDQPGLHNGDTVVMRRELPTLDAATIDESEALFGYDNPVWERGGKWFAFAAPPGRYRIESISGDRNFFELRFCLGSPSFEAGAGEVVYAGAFDLGSAAIRPDLNLDTVKAWLSKSGDAAERVRPAAYTNGSRGACGGTYIYAYEIPGAPFEPGYVWGGAKPVAAP